MEKKEKKYETKRVKKSNLNKKTSSKGKKIKFRDEHPKAAKAIKIGIIAFVLLAIITVGVLIGTFFGIFGDELKISEEDLVIKFKNSNVYDADGNHIATLSGGTKRKIVSLSEMADYLPKAYVAIEDERFEEHRGVDVKRTAAATFTFLLNRGNSSFGGSTITQQLVKNITTDDEDSGLGGIFRKVKEMAKAIQVEQYLSKDQILELYLNIIFIGGDDINGVALGSVYYFNKDVKDLSIAECAYLAGINHSPNAYKPFEEYKDKENSEELKQKMTEKINKRVNTVIGKMKELKYITQEEYDLAKQEVEDGLKFEKGNGASVTTDISYHTEAALDQIVEQLKEEKGMDENMAELYLYSSGLNIYTTQETDVQTVLEEELKKEVYVKPKKYKDNKTKETITQYGMPTMVIADHKTGKVVAAATAVGSAEDRSVTTKLGYMNWPTKLKKQTGSSMKPISVIVPGIDSGVITASTMYFDCETTFPGMGKPMKNESGYRNAPMSMRSAIEISQNIPHAKAMMNIGVENSMKYCEKMGIDNLGNEGVSLALGGLDIGISPTHMAMAYATIANDGVYIEPTFYTKVTDEKDEIVLEPKQEKNEVISEQTAYVVKSILTQPVLGASGTATYCKIKGMDTAAKTGTTNNSYDRWLCGFTPYYTAACWYGYETSQTVTGFGRNPAGQIWSNVMQIIHKELPNAAFEKPEGVKNATVCSVSGKLAVEGQCATTYSEVFVEGTLPGNCDGHVDLPICVESGKISAGSCPTEIRSFISLPEKEQNTNKWSSNYGEYATAPTESCPIHAPAAAPTPQPTTHVHEYTKTKTAATCVSPAKYVYSCKAGDHSYEEVISGEPATGVHNYVEGVCKVCSVEDPNYVPGSGETSGGSGATSGGSGETSGGTGTTSGGSGETSEGSGATSGGLGETSGGSGETTESP